LFIENICVGQYSGDYDIDKCGTPTELLKSTLEFMGDNWGYNYDSLLKDVTIWEEEGYIEVISIGQSVQGRELLELVVTDTNVSDNDKHRIYIHARTHPSEVQSFWVTDQIVEYLISDTRLGSTMREQCIFHIVPMFNPDGVELEYPRENADTIDIESNWNADTTEVEVQSLKDRFSELMLEQNPIEIALNMHSAYACKRYFVYHHENGTSIDFAEQEKFFISSVRDQFYGGIEPWSYYVSWQNSTPTQYPESWWWINHDEQVLALTYEDMNCSSAGFYDKTAYAILHGISDLLDLGYVNSIEDYISKSINAKVYPNPFREEVFIEWNNFQRASQIVIYDITGRQIRLFTGQNTLNGGLIWDGNDQNGNEVPAGTYVVQIILKEQAISSLVVKQ
jgi:hypothetical protein